MRGDDPQQAAIFSYLSPEERVPAEHPLRAIRAMIDAALKELAPHFDRLYSHTGRPSIAPEQLRRALLLQVLYTVCSEWLLFRWCVSVTMDDPVWDPSTFSKNRERLLEGEVARAFFDQVLGQARERGLLSGEHFTVDGTLLEAWAGQKSFKRKAAEPPSPPDDPGHPSLDFRGERRTNATHASTTDPEDLLYKKAKGQEAKLAYLGYVLMENRHSLAVDTRVTLGADKNDDTRDCVRELRQLRVTPHMAQNISGRSSAIDGRTTRHPGYAISQRKRQGVEEILGWLKTVGLLRKVCHRGAARVGWMFTCAAAVYNLVRMRTLAAVA